MTAGVPPWVHGPDVNAAMEVGAQIANSIARAKEAKDQQKLEAQAEADRNKEAGDRLRFDYDSLRSKRDIDTQDLDVQRQSNSIAALHQKNQSDALSDYRQRQIADRQRALKDGEDKARSAADKLRAAQADTAGLVDYMEGGGRLGQGMKKFPYADKTVAAGYLRSDLHAPTGGNEPTIPKMDFPAPGQPSGATAADLIRFTGVPANSPLINQVLGTNAPPGTGTNYLSPGDMLRQAASIAPDARAVSPVTTSTIAAPVSPSAKAAQGGYKIGSSYSGMKYLGGDPNEESNWQQSGK